MDKVGFFLTSNTGESDMERHGACAMAAIFPALSHVLYFAVPSSRSSAPLSPFCAALVQDHDDPGAVAISPAMIRSCASTISNSKCSPDYPWLQWPQPSLAGPPLWVFLLTASSQDSGSVPKPLTQSEARDCGRGSLS